MDQQLVMAAGTAMATAIAVLFGLHIKNHKALERQAKIEAHNHVKCEEQKAALMNVILDLISAIRNPEDSALEDVAHSLKELLKRGRIKPPSDVPPVLVR